MQFQATRHDQFACSRSYAAGEMTLHTVSAKTGHTARPRNFPITGRSDRRNVSTSHRRSLRKLQFLHNRLEARFLARSEEHTSELQSPCNLVCRLLLEKKKLEAGLMEKFNTEDLLDWEVMTRMAMSSIIRSST